MRIIIADASAIVRTILEQNLADYPEIKIVSSVSNGTKLINSVQNESADVVIIDLGLPYMDELDVLGSVGKSMQLPILAFAGTQADGIKATTSGAKDFMLKPALNSYNKDFFDSLVKKIKEIANETNASTQNAEKMTFEWPNSEKCGQSFKVLCIGASTGGPSAVSEVLSGLGNNFPLPVLYTQHIEIGADEKLAQWLSGTCKNISISIAKDGEEAKTGHVYMAPADTHLIIDYVKPSGIPVLRLSHEEPERFLRPAVNKLFRSAAQFYKKDCLAVLLTGMGMDGADGCKEICVNGGWTIVEDKSTCAVFGMPAAAIEAGGAKEVLPRGNIAKRVLELVKT